MNMHAYIHIYIYMPIYIHICIFTYIHTHTRIYIYIFMCVCVCVCVCMYHPTAFQYFSGDVFEIEIIFIRLKDASPLQKVAYLKKKQKKTLLFE